MATQKNPMNKSLNHSVTNRILAMKFASEFILIYPLITIMFGERGHVKAAGIGFLLALSMILSLVFEIPTGIIADRIPRKYILVFSLFFKTLSFATYLVAPSFGGYIVAAVFFAMSTALESGALQAYLYGALGEESRKTFGKFWSRVNAMVMISYTSAYIFTTIIGVNYPLLLTLSTLTCVVGLLIGLTLPVDSIERSSTSVRPKIFATAIKHITDSKKLIKLLLSGVLVVALAAVLIDFISLYYKQIGIDTRWVPIMLAAGNIVGAVLFWTLHSWDDFLEKHRISIVAIATILFLISLTGGLAVAAVSILIYTRMFRVLQVQYESKLQHLSNDQTRATISSIGNFASLLLGSVIFLLIGHFAIDNIIIQPMRIAMVVTALAYVGIHSFIRYKDSNEKLV